MTLRLAVAVFAALLPFATRANIPDPPALEATSYVLYDFASGTVLAESNPTLRTGPASITKVMLSYIVFDEIKKGRIKLDDLVTISEKAWRQGKDSTESRMFLDLGSRVKVEDLLHGVITQSGNDASVALAEHVAGSESAFAELMNQYAERLGMKDSHFTNAPGMPDEQHYSSARDLALLGAALIRDFPEYYSWFSLPSFTYNGIKQANRNLMLNMDRNVDGIKTGHTEAAGYCMLSSSKRDDRRLVAAVMGTKSQKYRAEASLELLDYGFWFFDSLKLMGKDSPAGTVRLWKGVADEVQLGTLSPVYLSLPRGSSEKATLQPEVPERLIAPLTAGQVVGTVTILIDGKAVRTEPLVVLADAPAGGFFKRLWHTIRLWFA
jgi:D-alanyl-D-alanine carboxypeptidase (penicillin-binding protein 5/6)